MTWQERARVIIEDLRNLKAQTLHLNVTEDIYTAMKAVNSILGRAALTEEPMGSGEIE